MHLLRYIPVLCYALGIDNSQAIQLLDTHVEAGVQRETSSDLLIVTEGTHSPPNLRFF